MKQETIYITQNSPFIKDIQIIGPEGTPINLTGYVPSMFVAKYFGSTLKYQVPASVINPIGGVIRVSINSDGTAAIPFGTMQYTIYLKPTGQDKTVILHGQAVIIPTV
jgi:hypothetical protein